MAIHIDTNKFTASEKDGYADVVASLSAPSDTEIAVSRNTYDGSTDAGNSGGYIGTSACGYSHRA